MKIRLRKNHVEKMLLWYWNTISQEFLNRQLTLATTTAIQYRLNTLRYRQQEIEPMNPIWSVPVVVSVVNILEGQIKIDVQEDFKNNILYTDWPA